MIFWERSLPAITSKSVTKSISVFWILGMIFCSRGSWRASTRRAARQFVNHGHVNVNGKKVDIPSYIVKPGDVISVRENSKEHKAMKETLETVNRNVEFVSFDKNKLEGTYLRYPERSELSQDVNESQVVEFYNR